MQVLPSESDDPDVADHHLTEVPFTALPIPDKLQEGIADAGFSRCTPIQREALPLALSGRDVAGQAQTGTGKTAAYLLALYSRLHDSGPPKPASNGPRALILAPTRELAVQIHADAQVLGKHLSFRLGLAFGGTDYDKQRRQLADGVDVLVGTPDESSTTSSRGFSISGASR